MIEKDRILIFGASGHARCIIDIVEQVGKYQIAGVVDIEKEKGTFFEGYQVLGSIDDLPEIIATHKVERGIIAIGDNYSRSKNAEIIRNHSPNFSFVCAIHPSVIIGKNVKIGDGTVVLAGVIITNDAVVGEHCCLSTKSSLAHDSVLDDFSSLGPGVTTGGGVKVGRCSVLGLGVNILHGRSIGKHSVVGSGSLVVKDIGDFIVAYGIPAKFVRTRDIDDRYL